MFPFQDYKTINIDVTNQVEAAVTTLSKRSVVSFESDLSTITVNIGSSRVYFQHPVFSTTLLNLFAEVTDGGSTLELNTFTLEAGTTIYRAAAVHQLKGILHILELPDVV